MAARATRSKATSVTKGAPALYTMLWPQHVVKQLIGVVDGQPLRLVFSRGNTQTDFARFKIAPGDILIPIHIDAGRICPIARMEVVYKGTAAAWALHASAVSVAGAPQDAGDELKRAAKTLAQVLVGVRGTPQHFHRPLPAAFVRALRYDGAKGARALAIDDEGKLVKHTGVDGVFRLTPESADELVSLAWI